MCRWHCGPLQCSGASSDHLAAREIEKTMAPRKALRDTNDMDPPNNRNLNTNSDDDHNNEGGATVDTQVGHLLGTLLALEEQPTAEANASPPAPRGLPPRLQFIMGVLVILEEEKGCLLQELLQQPETQEIIEAYLGSVDTSEDQNEEEQADDEPSSVNDSVREEIHQKSDSMVVKEEKISSDGSPESGESEQNCEPFAGEDEESNEPKTKKARVEGQSVASIKDDECGLKQVDQSSRCAQGATEIQSYQKGCGSDVLLRREMSRLPEEETAAYFEAIHMAPEIIKKESDPDRFVKFEEGNAILAAARLARYWKTRKKVFGPTRFYKPLDLSSDSALSAFDQEILKTGAMALLPPDSAGRSVVAISPERIGSKGDAVRAARLAARFYLLHHAALASDEVVFIRIMQQPIFDASMVQQVRKAVEEALPIRLHALHYCCVVETESVFTHIQKTVLPVVLGDLGKEFAKRTRVHIRLSASEIASQLKTTAGLELSAVPTSIGGTWSYEAFDQWILEQEQCKIKQSEEAKLTAIEQAPEEVVSPKVHFCLGVLSLLEQERQCNLQALLHDNATIALLQELWGHGSHSSLFETMAEHCAQHLHQEDESLVQTLLEAPHEKAVLAVEAYVDMLLPMMSARDHR